MRDRAREVVVTGTGVACHMGDDWPAIEAALREGRNTPFARWPAAVEHGTQCEIIGLYPGDLAPRASGSRRRRRASWAGRRSWPCAPRGSRSSSRGSRRATWPSSWAAAPATWRRTARWPPGWAGPRDRGRCRRPSSPASWPPPSPRTWPRVLGANGPSFTAAAACAGGAYNLLLAAQLVETGHVDAALAGGVDVADIHFHAGFDAMRAYTTRDNDRPERASRPYAADRAGFVFSEGAGVLVLETRAGRRGPGRPGPGTLRGFGMSSDGRHMAAPCSEGAELAMRRAPITRGVGHGRRLRRHHATSTPVGDVSEVRAMRRVFGERLVAYSSTKGYTGHPVSAAGPIEAIFTLAMLRGGFIAPCVNAEPLDPELLDYPPVVRPESRPLRMALSNSFGFGGGTNVTLVLGRG